MAAQGLPLLSLLVKGTVTHKVELAITGSIVICFFMVGLAFIPPYQRKESNQNYQRYSISKESTR